jgi:predicted GNAT family N-acyltransferase
VGAFEWRDEFIGTMRFVPMRGGLSSMEELLRTRAAAWAPPAGRNWEFGRLVLDPRYRAGPEMLQKCVFLAVSHLVQHFDCENAYASCNNVLSRLYRRFGFSVITSDVRVAGEEKPFNLIHARTADVLRAAAGDDMERALAHRLLSA